MSRPKIVLTGGGSAGHITVNLALIPLFLQSGWEIIYLGSFQGIESELISNIPEVKYYGIPTGKLRRYFDYLKSLVVATRLIMLKSLRNKDLPKLF